MTIIEDIMASPGLIRRMTNAAIQSSVSDPREWTLNNIEGFAELDAIQAKWTIGLGNVLYLGLDLGDLLTVITDADISSYVVQRVANPFQKPSVLMTATWVNDGFSQ